MLVPSPFGSKTVTRGLVLALVAGLLSTSLPVVAQGDAAPVPLGFDMGGVAEARAHGAPAALGSYWVGPWMAVHGWGGLDNALKTARAEGVTPVVYWYYWGDSISPSCIEQGCDGRSKQQWHDMTDTLANKIATHMGGARTIVVLENEFNKGGVTSSDYAPTFDAYLVDVGQRLDAVTGVELVLGFGAWGESSWSRFPQSAAMSDYIGFQMMRGSTRHTETQYREAGTAVAYYTKHIADTFGKPSFLYDIALSSYPDATWEKIQAETLADILDQVVASGATGLQGAVYRSVRDHWMDPKNYFGEAESHWGLRYNDGRAKPAWDVWAARATGAPAPAPAPAPSAPGSFEAESMAASTGGRVQDAAASNGAAWNVWSNGQLAQPLTNDAARYDVTVVARGTPALGAWPLMTLRVDGTDVATFTVDTTTLRAHKATATLPQNATVAVAFTNDAYVNGEDRNLIVDVVHIAAAAPENRAPEARFDATADGLRLAVDASASTDADGDPLTYAWDFGDGTTGAGATASHAYASEGTYVVTLTVHDASASGTTTRSVTLTRPNAAPVAAFDVSGADLAWRFDASASTDADGDALSHAWDFGDGATASGVNVSHAYATEGTFAVTLTVHDGAASDATTRSVTATRPNAAPVAEFASAGQGLAWTFDASGSHDPDGDALTYAWTLGDGKTASGKTLQHTYAKSGTYAVTLRVTDARGLESTTTRQVVVEAPFAATFVKPGGNEWWVAVTVDANKPLAGVCARVDGGACQALTLRWWGEWAASFRVPTGATVAFEATAASGEVAKSGRYVWPSATPAGAFAPTFTPYDGNEWWVQTRVDAEQPVAKVCARVDGGACQALTLRSWGAWAASFHAPKGSQVVFEATSQDGQVVKSKAYTWPQ